MRRTIFDISEDTLSLATLVEDCENPDDPEIIAIIEQWQSETEEARRDKIDNLVAYARECEARADALGEEIDRLKRQADALNGSAGWAEGVVKKHLEAFEVPKLETRRFRLSIVKNGGAAPMWVDEFADLREVEKSHPEHVRVKREWDKKEIAKALDAGAELEYAHFLKRGTRLSIR